MFQKIMLGLGCRRDVDTGLWQRPKMLLSIRTIPYTEDDLDDPSLFGVILKNVQDTLRSLGITYRFIRHRAGSLQYEGLAYLAPAVPVAA